MTQRILKIHYPGTVRELIALLKAGKGRVAPVGGGVSFSFSVPPKISELASLRALGLNRIRLDSKGLHLGALVTIEQLAKSPVAAKFRNGLLAQSASKVAATTNRNLITVGGNAIRLFIWSDLPAIYCAAGALFIIRGAKGLKKLTCEQFYKTQPLSLLKHEQFLEEILIPPGEGRSGAAYEKFSETANTFAIVSAAACVSVDRSGKCSSARLAIVGLQLLPRISKAAAKILEGKPPDSARIKEASIAAVNSVAMTKDLRVSGEYKKELAIVIARRVLEKAFSAAGGAL